MTLIWAHARSTGVTAANTLESYAQAVQEGADGIELDVHLTRDGHLVCLHDGRVPLPGGKILTVGDASVSDLAQIVVGDETTGPTRVPLLEEVYDLLAPTGLQLNVEVKNLLHRYPGITERIERSLRGSGMRDRIVVSSFQHSLLTELRERDGRIQTAALYADGLIDPWAYFSRIGITQVHPHFATLQDPGVLEGLHEAEMTLRVWTVDDPRLWERFITADIGGIITNDPAGALAVRDQFALGSAPEPGITAPDRRR